MSKKITIVLDSVNRIFSYNYPYINTFSWYLTNNAANSSLLSGRIYSNNLFQNVTKLVIHELTIPYGSAIPPSNNTIRCFISQFPNKFYFGDNLNNNLLPFHFEFSAFPLNNRIHLIPKNDTLEFKPPLSSIQELSLSFYNPYSLYDFELDYGYYTIIFGNPTIFNLLNPTTVPLSEGQTIFNTVSNLKSQILTINSGDNIYVVSKIKSSSSALNSALNSQLGFSITKTSTSQFTIPLDTSAIPGYAQTNVFVYYASYRFSVVIDAYFH